MQLKGVTLMVLSMCVALSACAKHASTEKEGAGDIAGPSASVFVVDVSLSDLAKPRFGQSGESVIVSTRYYGEPAGGVEAAAVNDIGLVDLGQAEVELSGDGRAAFDGSALLRSRRGLVHGEPQVDISVFSGRRTSPDNILDCDSFQGTLRDAASEPIRVGCRLISEAEDAGPQP